MAHLNPVSCQDAPNTHPRVPVAADVACFEAQWNSHSDVTERHHIVDAALTARLLLG